MHQGVKVIDVHGHISTPPQFRTHGLNILIGTMGGSNKLAIPDDVLRQAAADHIRCLDERNIDVQLISPRPIAMLHFARGDMVLSWSRNTNDIIRQSCDLFPGRFAGVAQLPQQSHLDTSNCIAELERCIKELGFVAAIVNPDPSGERNTPGMDHEYWYPLYKRAEELAIPLLIHGSVCRNDPRVDIFDNFTFEQTLATHALERGDVFHRFPNLKIIVAHCGGALSRLQPRDAPSSGVVGGGQKSSHVQYKDKQYLDCSQNLFFDTCAYDRDFLGLALKQRGKEQMVFGTEAPGVGTFKMNRETGRPSDDLVPVIDSFEFLNDADKRSIFHDTSRRIIPRLQV